MPAKRIVVLGGGFGGAFTAKYLSRRVQVGYDHLVMVVGQKTNLKMLPGLAPARSPMVSIPSFPGCYARRSGESNR